MSESNKPTAPESATVDGRVIYVDATGHVAGRLSSILASQLLSGRRIVVLNAENAVVSGRRTEVFADYRKRLEISSRVNPIYGPIHPRRPDNILRRMVRGMVPKTKSSGRAALKRLRVYIGTPEKYTGMKLTKFEEALAQRPLPLYVSLAEVAESIGWSSGG